MKRTHSSTTETTPNHPTSRLGRDREHRRRRGVALLETLIAAGVVLTMLGVAAPLLIRSARIWKQTQHYQFATDELSGQMDRLIAMSAQERKEALDQLSISPAVRRVLHEATLAGNIVSDDDGTRIELAIDWERLGNPTPATLVAWIDPFPSADDSTPDTNTAPESSVPESSVPESSVPESSAPESSAPESSDSEQADDQ